ncbi:MAG: transposase family protein, partial [Pleurocapsa sp. SU_196_0]|nr:transposase family protein [Pleurocapsa sp. SU_196_0]
RKARKDAGQTRIPRDLVELCISLWVTNPNASSKRIRRIIELNDPRVLEYRASPRAAKLNRLSVNGIARVRQGMERTPEFRYALMDSGARREFHRVWIGEVMASRALELVEADMTRCDVFVYDAETDSVYRLRVHAMIDVFSGCIPAFVFTRAEDQLATNRMLMLGLLEKPAPWTSVWPVWGKPERLYWDNGKTYRSERSHTALEALGVTIIHSKPRVSHSRGKIERFFGTLHAFESTLPGYAGENTKERDQYRIAELWAQTPRVGGSRCVLR